VIAPIVVHATINGVAFAVARTATATS
jgi:hypothetical protein